MKLSEITQIHPGDYEGAAQDLFADDEFKEINQAYEHRKELPGGGGYMYGYVDGHKNYDRLIYIFDDDIKEKDRHRDYYYLGDEVAPPAVGQLRLQKMKGFSERTYEVSTSTVLEKYRGRRVGLALYGIALTLLKLVLISDILQTPKGSSMWRNMAKIPGCEVVGLIPRPTDSELGPYSLGTSNFTEEGIELVKKIAKLSLDDQDTINDNMMDKFDLEPFKDDDRYWTFPVDDQLKSRYFNVFGARGIRFAARKE